MRPLFPNFRLAWHVFAHHQTPVTRPLSKNLFWFAVVQMMIHYEHVANGRPDRGRLRRLLRP